MFDFSDTLMLLFSVSALKNCPSESSNIPTPNIGFSKVIIFTLLFYFHSLLHCSRTHPPVRSQILEIQPDDIFQAMSGFIMMMTQQGKLLYISENAADYLGHSMVK